MMRIASGFVVVAVCGMLAACSTQSTSDETPAPENTADGAPSPVIATLDCEPFGDAAVAIEKAEDGTQTLVTIIQSEMVPDAEPIRFPLEPTGASAGGDGTRLADVNGEFTVWIKDDGSATVKSGENEVSCKT